MWKKISRSSSFKEAKSPGTEVKTMDPHRHEQPLGPHGPLQHTDSERHSHHQKRRPPPDRRPSVDSYAADDPYNSNPSASRHIKSGVPDGVPEKPSRPPVPRGIPGQFEPRPEPEDRGHSGYHGDRNSFPHRPDMSHMESHRSKASVNGPDPYSDSEGGYVRAVGNDSKSWYHKVGKRIKEEIRFDGEEYDDARSDKREREKQILDFKAIIEHQTRQINDLQKNLRFETENSRKAKETLNKMQYAMENKELFVGRQDSDDAIYTRFYTLINQIKQWSKIFAQRGEPRLQGEYSPAAIDHIRRVAPMIVDVQDFGKFLEERKNMRLFVRGYVGFAVADHLFRSLPYSSHGLSMDFRGVDVWMDDQLAQPLSILERSLLNADRSKISNREFHDWRVLTTTLVSRLDTESKIGKGMGDRVTDCAEKIMLLIGQWVSEDDGKALEEGLQAILLSAVSLSKTMRCQRASWSVRHIDGASARDCQLPYDEVVMNDEEHRKEDMTDEEMLTSGPKLVQIIASPGLFKRGNSDGELYEFESCLYRSEVKCG